MIYENFPIGWGPEDITCAHMKLQNLCLMQFSVSSRRGLASKLAIKAGFLLTYRLASAIVLLLKGHLYFVSVGSG